MSHPTFIIMPFDALMDDRLSLRQIRVLMAILSWRKANTNLAAVSREMIAERTGYPVSRVSAITSELEQLGWIKKHGNGGRSRWSRYEISEINPGTFGKRKETKKNVNSPKETVTNSVTVTNSETVTDLGVNGYQNGNETVTNSVTPIDTVVNTKVNTEDIYTPKPPADKKARAKKTADRFEEFWQAYPNTPRRVAKKKCRERWRSRKLDQIADQIIDHVLAMKKTQQWLDGFEPGPMTYINQSRWEDGVPEERATNQRAYGQQLNRQEALEQRNLEIARQALEESYG